MRIIILVVSVVAMTLGLTSLGLAGQVTYYPPERIDCLMNETHHLSCSPLNREFVVEDMTNTDLDQGEASTFHFIKGVAYFPTETHEAHIEFVYYNDKGNLAKLHTINPTSRPDLNHGYWRKLAGQLYLCEAGYLNCPIVVG